MSSGRVIVRALTASGQYSGGRLHAWVLAEGFAHAGFDVTFWGDAVPAFTRDFAGYPRHDRISWHSGNATPNVVGCDVFVIVPHLGAPRSYYPRALLAAALFKAKIVLLNFESPNWFNAYSPEPRDPKLWDDWASVARMADVILSSTSEGTRYAREFYRDISSHCAFEHLHPAINSRVADAVCVPRQKQIVCITRFGTGHLHKGGEDIVGILGPHLRGFTISLIVGAGGIGEDARKRLVNECQRHGINCRILQNVSDEDKFREIKSSVLMVFPSYFEGFGYPPVEALYCGVPCVAYDLPVLREVCGDGLDLVPAGSLDQLREAVAAKVHQPQRSGAEVLRQHVLPFAEFDFFSESLRAMLVMRRPISSRSVTRIMSLVARYVLMRVEDIRTDVLRRIRSRLHPTVHEQT